MINTGKCIKKPELGSTHLNSGGIFYLDTKPNLDTRKGQQEFLR